VLFFARNKYFERRVSSMRETDMVGISDCGFVAQSKAEPYDGAIFPHRMGGENEVVTIWSSDKEVRLKDYINWLDEQQLLDFNGVSHAGIRERLVPILCGTDSEWCVRQAEMSRGQYLSLWFGHVGEIIPVVDLANKMTFTLRLKANWGLQIRQQALTEDMPYRKTLYKVPNKSKDDQERILAIWRRDMGTVLYRMSLVGTSFPATREFYPYNVDLLVDNL